MTSPDPFERQSPPVTSGRHKQVLVEQPAVTNGDGQQQQQSSQDEREINKRFLVSLAMILPAVAAIIGVVAWAISAEVLMNGQRELSRRMQSEHSNFRHSNRYHSPPAGHSPLRELLLDPKFVSALSAPIEPDSAAIQKRMDDDESAFNSANNHSKLSAVVFGEKLRERLHQESFQQMLAKLLENQARSQVATNPKTGLSGDADGTFETIVTQSRPVGLALRRGDTDGDSKKTSQPGAAAPKKKSKKSDTKKRSSSKRKSPTTTTSTTTTPKPSKAKTYEKEIDRLLEKIERLEREQATTSTTEAPMTQSRGPPSAVAEKIRKFMETYNPEAAAAIPPEEHDDEEEEGERGQSPSWSGDSAMPSLPPGFPQPPPGLPPLPFMPYMPPPPPMPQNSPPHNYEHFPPPTPYYHRPTGEMHSPQSDSQSQFHEQQPSYEPNSDNYEQQYDQQQTESQQPFDANRQIELNSHQYQQEFNQFQQQSTYDPEPPQQQQQQPPPQPVPTVAPKRNFFRRKFKLSSLLNSVIPKTKKQRQKEALEQARKKQQEEMMKDYERQNYVNTNRDMQPTPSQDYMATGESQMYGHVDRGYGPHPMLEQPGFSVSMGAGPVGGGGHVKASPLGIVKTLLQPFSGRPKWINGKIVLGVVLENGIGKKPKTVFQHFSTGRI